MNFKKGFHITEILSPDQMMHIPRKEYPRSKKSKWKGELAQMTRENLPIDCVPIDKKEMDDIDEIKNVGELVTELKIHSSKFRDSKVNMLLAAIRCGVSLTKACKLAGISISTYQNWYNRGKSGEEPFATFIDNLESIRVELEQWCLEAIKRAADPSRRVKTITTKIDDKGKTITETDRPETFDWKAAQWLLEHISPDEYGKNAIDNASTVNNTTNNVVIQLPSNGRDNLIKEINPSDMMKSINTSNSKKRKRMKNL